MIDGVSNCGCPIAEAQAASCKCIGKAKRFANESDQRVEPNATAHPHDLKLKGSRRSPPLLRHQGRRTTRSINRRACSFTIAAALLAGSAAAADPDNSSYSIGITGFVPVICHAQFDASVVPSQSGETSLGQLNEYCNNPNGYQIFAESSPELADATLLVDGEAITLAAGASTLVVSEDGPLIASRQVSLVSNGAAGSLTFRLVVL